MNESQGAEGGGGPQGSGKPISVTIPLLFERPAPVSQHEAIGRLVDRLFDHQFEIHDIRPEGEKITRVYVFDHIELIELIFDDEKPAALDVRFTVRSREDRDILVWTSSLMFQYLHYHIARLAQINGAPHTLDWDARQDPQLPERVKAWVDGGQSMIERFKIVQRS